MNDIIIRHMRRSDFGQAAELFICLYREEPYRESWTRDRALRYLEQCFCNPEFCLVMEKSGMLIGYVQAHRYVWWDGDYVRIDDILVAKGEQGTGHGSMLMKKLEEECRARGIARITLESNIYSKALAFYKKNGYLETGWTELSKGL
jgi:GNAT superfamily N-acetyltransferase